jgi:hypothetical protein
MHEVAAQVRRVSLGLSVASGTGHAGCSTSPLQLPDASKITSIDGTISNSYDGESRLRNISDEERSVLLQAVGLKDYRW